MKNPRTFLYFAAILASGIVAYFAWRYFFDPAGISIARGEICTSNETSEELVFSVEAIPGAKIIALLDNGQSLCAPSPIGRPRGIILVGETEEKLACRHEVADAAMIAFLARRHSPQDCDWGSTPH